MTENKKLTSDFGVLTTGLIYLYFVLTIYAILSLCGVPFNKLFTSNKEDAVSNTYNSSKANNPSNTNKADHKQNPVYQQGHSAGVLAKTLNDNSGCNGDKAQEQGACVDQVSKDLWCEGYNDGYYGR
jgi:hypothetical protein